MITLSNGCEVLEQVFHEVVVRNGCGITGTVIAVDRKDGLVVGHMAIVCWDVWGPPSPEACQDYATGGGHYGAVEAKKAFAKRTGRDPASEYLWSDIIDRVNSHPRYQTA
jgi:hypothetical protein